MIAVFRIIVPWLSSTALRWWFWRTGDCSFLKFSSYSALASSSSSASSSMSSSSSSASSSDTSYSTGWGASCPGGPKALLTWNLKTFGPTCIAKPLLVSLTTNLFLIWISVPNLLVASSIKNYFVLSSNLIVEWCLDTEMSSEIRTSVSCFRPKLSFFLLAKDTKL